MPVKPDDLTVDQVAAAIAIPTPAWAGNCYGIACAIVDAGLIAGEPVYGHWRGPISPRSTFAGRAHLGFCHHGWIELEDGRVLDPTRWVFEAAEPYLYLGEEIEDFIQECRCGHIQDEHERNFMQECKIRGCGCEVFDVAPGQSWPYDRAGQTLREARQLPAPANDPNKTQVTLHFGAPDEASWVALIGVGEVAGSDLNLGIMQAHWLATLSPRRLGRLGQPVYTALLAADLGGLIPIDNRDIVLGSDRQSRTPQEL